MKYLDFEPSKTKRNSMPPMRSFKELAQEFGITTQALRGYLSTDKSAPKPVFKHQNSATKNAWYIHKDMQDWWKNRTVSK